MIFDMGRRRGEDRAPWFLNDLVEMTTGRVEFIVDYQPMFVARLNASEELRREQDAAITYGLLGPSTMEELAR